MLVPGFELLSPRIIKVSIFDSKLSPSPFPALHRNYSYHPTSLLPPPRLLFPASAPEAYALSSAYGFSLGKFL